MTGLLVATRYLTVVPLPGRVPGGLEGLGRAALWFPVVGLGLGVVVALVDAVGSRLFPPLLAALVTLTAWKVLTGGLHLEGLADCLDGLVGRDPVERLAIMRDSRIGAFGATGLILFLLLELGAVAELPPGPRRATLIAAPAIARATPPLLARAFAVAAGSTHGAAFRAGLGRAAVPVVLAAACVVAVGALGVPGVVTVIAGVVVALGVGRLFVARLGGINGDVLGAAVELSELAVLLTVSAWVHAGL